VGRRARESPLVDLRPELGSRRPWWWRGVVASGTGPGCPTPGEARRPVGQHVLRAPMGPSQGVGRPCDWGSEQEPELAQAASMAARRSSRGWPVVGAREATRRP
jgi:hypothetical protein